MQQRRSRQVRALGVRGRAEDAGSQLSAPSPEAAALPIRCDNTTKSGKLLFRFPKRRGRAAAVDSFVRGRRPTGSCSDSSVICSEHFAPVCFDVSSVIQQNLCFSERLRPVAGAVSILHPVAFLLKPKGKKEETERAAGEGRKAPGSQAVRQSQATPGPAFCTLLWPG
ncbi:unnamed protein product [Rangifer tarandus platyrhynchus]|uniref:Uncharacterized protein n=2 Tax=Rangifer tarandus platyrhynchus TaxID=3082113 RepID=A0AC59ZZ53_RANTA|nr:unnamed protein product [Rangifer tarandus platyrhynchus]